MSLKKFLNKKKDKKVIINTTDTLNGAPRLKGRRIDVGHVIWGITDYDNGDIKSYQVTFDVSIEEIKHAILYCKDQVCEIDKVNSSCNACTKSFSRYDYSFEEEKDYWEIAGNQFHKLKTKFNLPNDYKSLIENDK